MIERVVLVGLSGVGKSTTARILGSLLDWTVFDLDQAIEQETGRTIPEIFRSDGECRFRAIEAEILRRALTQTQMVIATGGGAVVEADIWGETGLGAPTTLTVWLDASTDQIVSRLRRQAAQEGDKANRPLLDGDPTATIEDMRSRRSAAYARARIALQVTDRDPSMVAAELATLVKLSLGQSMTVELEAGSGHSRIEIGPGASQQLAGAVLSGWPHAQQVFVAYDAGVRPYMAGVIVAMQQTLGIPIHQFEIPSGESSKSIACLTQLWDWMLTAGVQRSDLLIAIGGGVVGDLAGFAAATVLRGIGLMHVPTTLLSMVDSSVGGKTAINHQTGKNLIGSFHQAQSVLIDSSSLTTLPARDCRSGWAEIIKHAVIEASTPGGSPAVLLETLERNHESLIALQEPLLSWVIWRNVSIKAAVVAADEREAGIRGYLNFGHTIGHGIEAAGFTLLHGEAVGVGMSAAFKIAELMDLVDAGDGARVRRLLESFGLPLTAAVDPDKVRQKMAADKKKSQGRQTWVLPHRDGRVRLHSDVPEAVVRQALDFVTRAGEMG